MHQKSRGAEAGDRSIEVEMGMETAAATAFVKIVMGRLILWLEERYKRMKNLKDDIDFIKDELAILSAYMDDQRDAPRTAVAREYSRMIREWTHDTEDCIEHFLHRVTCKEGSSWARRSSHRLRTFRSRYRFATRIKKLKERLEKASSRIQNLPEGIGQASAGQREYDHVERHPVGLEKSKGELLALLDEVEGQPQQLRVISIVGFGGSGKTTLARQVYNDPYVVNKFPCRAWVAVRSLEHRDAMGILKYLHHKLLPDQQYSETSLTEYLKDKRYLIVIDAIGDSQMEQWDNITSTLEENGQGSRIIVTTTFRSAANRCSNGNGFVYKIRAIGNKDSMTIALGERLAEDLQGSAALLKKCDGLPLALVSVANQLKTEDECTGQLCANLCSRLGSYLEREDNDKANFARLRAVLADNYTGLSNHTVRTCLLYLGIFPNDRPLRRNVIIRRWLAEGYAGRELLDSNLKSADENFDTFIKWNIIQPVGTSFNEVLKTCKTHGIVHEFVLHKSMIENFIMSFDASKLEKVRHLFVHDRNGTNSRTNFDMNLKRVRSLTVFGNAGDAISDFGKYKLMRVLDLEECSDVCEHHLKDMCKLWNLRYLSLGGEITELPKTIAMLKLLETLHVSKTAVTMLPVDVIRMPCLIHLIGKFKLSGQVGAVSSKLERQIEKSNLETLVGFVLNDQSHVFLQLMVHMKKLRKVKLWCEFTGCSSNYTDHLSSAIREYMKDHMDYADVRSLSIDFGNCSEQPQNFLHSVEAPGYLSSLKLHGELPTLPPFAYAKYLRELCLSSTTLTQDVLTAVSNLEFLLYLKLIADHLENFVIQVGAFRRLKRLRFVVRCRNPILPQIQDGALPKLVSLQLICEHLDGLSGIDIRRLNKLKEVALGPGVNDQTRGQWEAAARNHPNKPNVLPFIRVDDTTENPVATPEESAPDQTGMQTELENISNSTSNNSGPGGEMDDSTHHEPTENLVALEEPSPDQTGIQIMEEGRTYSSVMEQEISTYT